MDQKTFLGYLAAALALISYVPYFINIFRGHTKPHAFTWLIWATLNFIGFAAQTASGGGAGAWILLVNGTLNATIGIVGLSQRYVKFVMFDWLALSGAALAIILWRLTSDPLWAVLLISISDSIGFLPTLRKAYLNPFQETVSSFVIGTLGFICSIFALQDYSINTWLYPAMIVGINLYFVSMVTLRRQTLKSQLTRSPQG